MDDPKHIGENSVPRGEDTWAQGNRKRRRSGRQQNDESEDELESDEEEEPYEAEEGMESQSQSQSQIQAQVAAQGRRTSVSTICKMHSGADKYQARWAVETDDDDGPRRKRPSMVPETQLSDD